MLLKRKIMIYVGLLTICLLTLLYLISERALLRNYETMELNHAKEGMKRVLLAFFDENKNLGSIAINYAGWDDTYRFIERPSIPPLNDPYLTANYPDSLFVSSRLNVTLLMNNQNKVYFAKAYDFTNNIHLPYPQSFIDALVREHPSLLYHADESSRNHGLILMDKQPVILASYPILTSENKGPVHGKLVFARYLDDNYIRYVSEKADVNLSYDLVGPQFKLPGKTDTVSVNGKESLPFWSGVDKRSITNYVLLPDHEMKPAVILKFAQSRELYEQARNNTWFYMLYFSVAGFAFFLLITHFLGRTIFKRLNRAIENMQEIENGKNLSIRIQESGKDEITQLEMKFNRMMTSLEKAHTEIQYQADHDVLTCLPNRKSFYKRLEDSVAHGARFAILFIDLDRFKLVNDTWGHQIGDLLLIQVAARLTQCLKGDDFLCRLGGDEFCLISPYSNNDDQIELTAKEIKEKLNQAFELDGHDLKISASIGISFFPEHGTEPGILLQNSDYAMLKVKEEGRNNFQRYKMG